jgi:aerobic carbon-monoxide dehydrogenase large subunit
VAEHASAVTSHEKTGGFVGRPIPRFEDPALVTGRGRFSGDLAASHWVRFVRSPVACGRIVGMTAPAGALVITAADVAALPPILPMLHKFNYVPIGQPVLAKDVVRFVGEPIAAVVAPSREAAEDFAERVVVEIEEMRPVVEAMAALADQAPLVHVGARDNVIVEGRVRTPGFDAVAAAASRRVKIAIRSRRQNASPMEPRAAHAAYDPADDRITLTCATQMPHLIRTAVADAIGIPESGLRVIAPDVGGGFGQKMSLGPEFVLVAWLARRLRSSVAWTEDRRENLVAAITAATSTFSSKAASTPMRAWSRSMQTWSPTSAPIPATPPPAGSSR